MHYRGLAQPFRLLITSLVVLTFTVALPDPLRAQTHDHGALPHGIPDFCASPTMQSMANGAWSNPLTWSAGRVPRAGDRIVVAAGTTVTFDTVSNEALSCVGVEGRLNFSTTASTRLTTGTLMVMEGGHLWIGDAGTPVSASALAEIVIASQPLNTSSDPEQYGTGLLAFGKVTMHGAVRSPAFVRLGTEPHAGQTALTAASAPTGWRSGDRLVIPDTRHLKWNETQANYQPQWEERTLASVSGSNLSMNSALAFNHLGARNLAGTLELLPHVGNLTRNVVVRSASPTGTRGHVLLTHRADIDIRYAAFKDLGRTTVATLDSTTFNDSHQVTHIGTNQIGRYSVHLHHLMGPTSPQANGYQYTLIGNAIEGGTKWGIAIHNTHFGLVKGNVIYNVNGAALMAEDGSESYNVIEGNFAVRGTGEGGRDAGGREGTGFYFRGPNNYVRGNVAANFLPGVGSVEAAYGYKYFLFYLGNIRVPNAPGADVSVDSQWTVRDSHAMKVLQFEDNEVYGATENGLTYWWLGSFGNDVRNAPRSVFKNLRVWHIYNRGIYNYPSSNVTIDGMVMRGGLSNIADTACCSLGIEGGDYMADGWIIRNADIQGMMRGIFPSTENGRTIQVIEHSLLRNQLNVDVRTLFTSGYRADGISPRRVIIADTILSAPPSGSYTAVSMEYRGDPVRNLVKRDEVVVLNHNRVQGDNFQVLYSAQAPSFIVPQTILNSDGTPRLAGSPTGGLTNSQAWATHHVAIAGAVAWCSTTKPDFEGFTCPTSITYTSPPPSSDPPPPPPPTEPPPPPPPTEVCGDKIDNDGDGQIDEGCPTAPPPPPPSSDESPWVPGDFDGDGLADLNLFRPGNVTWYSITSASAFKSGVTTAWGVADDIPVAGDYDGDGKMDIAVYRPSNGTWYIRTSSSNLTGSMSITLGVSTDVPVPADYDGDGRTDVAVFRPSTARWYVRTSSSELAQVVESSFGAAGDVPAPADYDGDGRADLAVFRPAGRTWNIKRSTDSGRWAYKFGLPSGIPVPADYDGDGKADIAMYGKTDSSWNVLTSSSAYRKELFRASGRKGDVPVTIDQDGDGKTDFVAFHPPTGSWFKLTSTAPFQTGELLLRWGQNGDIPVPANRRQ